MGDSHVDTDTPRTSQRAGTLALPFRVTAPTLPPGFRQAESANYSNKLNSETRVRTLTVGTTSSLSTNYVPITAKRQTIVVLVVIGQ